MTSSLQKNFAGFLFLFFSLALPVAGMDSSTTNAYDGNWWLSVGIREQIGFLNGFRDCYVYEYKGPVKYGMATTYEWQRQITAFFENAPDQRRMPAAEFILRAHVETDGKAPFGEKDKEDHGIYDGQYWNQAFGLGGLPEQRGFIAGYLWGHAHLCRNKDGAYSKAPEEYASLITRWYHDHRKNGDAGGDREKIAKILFGFRDQPAPVGKGRTDRTQEISK